MFAENSNTSMEGLFYASRVKMFDEKFQTPTSIIGKQGCMHLFHVFLQKMMVLFFQMMILRMKK
jgi:hypothetical protein